MTCATPGCPNLAREQLARKGPAPRFCETCGGSAASHRAQTGSGARRGEGSDDSVHHGRRRAARGGGAGA